MQLCTILLQPMLQAMPTPFVQYGWRVYTNKVCSYKGLEAECPTLQHYHDHPSFNEFFWDTLFPGGSVWHAAHRSKWSQACLASFEAITKTLEVRPEHLGAEGTSVFGVGLCPLHPAKLQWDLAE
jgi:hypothetical protein